MLGNYQLVLYTIVSLTFSVVRLRRSRLHRSFAGVHNCCARLLSAYLLRACITSILTADRKFSRLIPLSFSEDRDGIQEGTTKSRHRAGSARVFRGLCCLRSRLRLSRFRREKLSLISFRIDYLDEGYLSQRR